MDVTFTQELMWLLWSERGKKLPGQMSAPNPDRLIVVKSWFDYQYPVAGVMPFVFRSSREASEPPAPRPTTPN
jgi:hypothetical protein